MIKKKTLTILGIDISQNGTGVALISNDAGVISKFDSPLDMASSHLKFLFGGVAVGVCETSKSRYSYSFNSLINNELSKLSTVKTTDNNLRAGVVFNGLILPLLVHNPSCIVIEDYNYQGNGRIFNIAEFTGVIKYLLATYYSALDIEVPIYTMPPLSLKKFITGNGAAYDKRAIADNLKDKYGIEISQPDIADALSLALSGSVVGGDKVDVVKNKLKLVNS